MRFSPGSFLALGVFGLVLTAPCQADPIYSYVFGQRNYTIAPGGTVAGKSAPTLSPESEPVRIAVR